MLTSILTHRHFDVFNVKWEKKRPRNNGGTVQFISNSHGNITEIKFNILNDDIWFDEPQFLKVEEGK